MRRPTRALSFPPYGSRQRTAEQSPHREPFASVPSGEAEVAPLQDEEFGIVEKKPGVDEARLAALLQLRNAEPSISKGRITRKHHGQEGN